MMKKIIAVVLLLAVAVTFAACAQTKTQTQTDTAKTPETKVYSYTVINETGRDADGFDSNGTVYALAA